MGYNILRNANQGVFSGLAATLFGQDVASGKVGENLGNSYYQQPTQKGVQLAINPTTGMAYNATTDLSNWDARYAQGYQSRAAAKYNVAQVNVPVTDAAFAKIGLNTAQVEYIQMHNPSLVNSIVMKLKNGGTLTAQEKAALANAGYSAPAHVEYVNPTGPTLADIGVRSLGI